MSRVSIRRSGLLAAVPAAFLTAEFVVFDLAFYVGKPFGNDARLYLLATQAWLNGGDPWTVASEGVRFAAPPITLLPFAPFAWLSADGITAVVFVASIAAALFLIRRLSLPPWWLLFPPLVEALWSGSVTLIVVALALTRLESLAVLLKSYAALPALLRGHTRHLAIAAVIAALTVAFLPWRLFFSHDLMSALSAQAFGGRSAWIAPSVLFPLAFAGLALVGRERAAWFSVPALWPATQFHYSVFAMAARPTALASAILALPLPGAPVVALVAEAAVLQATAFLRRRRPVPSDGSAAQEGDAVPVQVVR